MITLQVSRSNNLKIPKRIEDANEYVNNVEDKVAIKKAIATADDKKINTKEMAKILDEEIEEEVGKIPFGSNDLVVVTYAKKLCAYVITVTEKSPKKFRGVFVNRMQNYCLDVIEELLKANFIKMNSSENKMTREICQQNAIIKLKLLGYVSMVAESSGCILSRQYKIISSQLAETINLIVAWKKSDDERWKNRILG